ncbi:hypothetical protein CCMA1212_003491 [Trichoderma ghanense]|uniref:Uncharacterized protein n=1 Tax=Trichoderma ghanense TaxID=65468 RepID=A0ABY2HCG5_9HYPO
MQSVRLLGVDASGLILHMLSRCCTGDVMSPEGILVIWSCGYVQGAVKLRLSRHGWPAAVVARHDSTRKCHHSISSPRHGVCIRTGNRTDALLRSSTIACYPTSISTKPPPTPNNFATVSPSAASLTVTI